MKQIVCDIIENLDQQPERWRVAGYTWDRDDSLRIWRRNMPILNVSIYAPFEMRLTIWEKIRLYLAFRKWSNAMPLDDFLRKRGQ